MNDNKKIKILSIEDDEFMKIFLNDVFWIHGAKYDFDFCSVSTIKKAEEKIKNPMEKPDLILLDLLLPEEEGKLSPKTALQFLETLKSSPETKNIKIIVFSGISDKEIVERAKQLGADKFLTKGDHLPVELIETVKELIAKK